ncbi:IPIL1 protein, partial [Upupa epops]|nr:IPIL1 protein [Upupa epops]
EDVEEEAEDVLESDAIYVRRVQWPGLKLVRRTHKVMKIADDLLKAFQDRFTGSFFPMIQPAIGIGSAFEGWSPYEDDTVYQVLMPLKACFGHEFHVELGPNAGTAAKDSRIRVELECTCTKKHLGEHLLCFLHPLKEMRTRKLSPSLLDSLCTNSYLDMHKTVEWFQSFVKSAWATLPQSRCYKMQLLPSRHSCKLQLKHASGRTLIIEMLLGVQLGNTDIFACSQETEATINASTTWAKSCAVAEMKMFRIATREVPHGSCHLKCLYICTHIVRDTGFSTYMIKTVMMHLLASTPLSEWCKANFLFRLDDTMRYLRHSIEEKRLNHFCYSNENMPKEIILPPEFQEAQPPNLFQHLQQDASAHPAALLDFEEL